MTKKFDFVTQIGFSKLNIAGEAWYIKEDNIYDFRIDSINMVFDNVIPYDIDITQMLDEIVVHLEGNIKLRSAVMEHIESGLFTEEIH